MPRVNRLYCRDRTRAALAWVAQARRSRSGRHCRRRCLAAHADCIPRPRLPYRERYDGARVVETGYALGQLLAVRPRMRHHSGNARLLPVLLDALYNPRVSRALFREQIEHPYATYFADMAAHDSKDAGYFESLEQQVHQERSASPFTMGTTMPGS